MKSEIIKLLQERYFLKDERSWGDLAKRVSGLYDPIFNSIKNMEFIPSSPTLMNANTRGERTGTLSSCFPLGLEDSIDGIFNSVKESALVTKAGGGVGYDISVLRGSTEIIETLNAKSSGPLSFMEVFNSTLDSIRQGGKRRGAGMFMMRVNHPNILDFITCKRNLQVMNRFNLSVKLSDEFYTTLENNPNNVFLVKPIKGEAYPLVKEGKTYTYKMVWDLIIELAHQNAEPGIINEDVGLHRLPFMHMSDRLFANPCSEYISAFPYTSCNLGSINLAKLVKHNKLDWERLGELTELATIFLNKVIDNNEFILDKIKKTTLDIRPIGIGVMGLGHLFYQLGLVYGDSASTALTKDIFKFITLRSIRKSVDLARRKGAYPLYNRKEYMRANARFFDQDEFKGIDVRKLVEDIKAYGVYNSSNVSVAPTGSIGTIADSSGGIEPVFALSYVRKVEKLNKEYDLMYQTDPVFDHFLDTHHKDKKTKILEYVAEHKGSCYRCPFLSQEEQNIFVTAGDISTEAHMNILEATANNINLSVSKTINLPESATKEDVAKAYIEAHKRGVVGVTVYRDNCRSGILVHDVKEKTCTDIQVHNAPKRPMDLEGLVFHYTVKKQKMFVVVGMMGCSPFELFAGRNYSNDGEIHIPTSVERGIVRKEGKSQYYLHIEDKKYLLNDSSVSDEQEGMCRLLSLSLRHGAPIEFVVQQLERTRGDLFSISKVIVRSLKHFLEEGAEIKGEVCPECKNKLIRKEGCVACSQCHWSRCG